MYPLFPLPQGLRHRGGGGPMRVWGYNMGIGNGRYSRNWNRGGFLSRRGLQMMLVDSYQGGLKQTFTRACAYIIIYIGYYLHFVCQKFGNLIFFQYLCHTFIKETFIILEWGGNLSLHRLGFLLYFFKVNSDFLFPLRYLFARGSGLQPP